MKGRQTALMPGNGDKVGYWLTPPDLMAKLQEEFHFDFDACPYPRPAGFDGLKEEWGDRSIYANPPFTDSLAEWTKKAIAENDKGKTVVLIAPIDLWVARFIRAGAEIRLPPVENQFGRIAWIDPQGRSRMSPRSHALFILRGKKPSPPITEAGP